MFWRRQALSSLSLIRACSVLLGVLLFSLVLRPGFSVFDLPLTEDGYYLQAISRNIGLGHGLTIDGHQWTNGFQPLFAFLVAPLYALFSGDRAVSMRGVLAVSWLMQVITALLLGSIVKTSLRFQGVERSRIAFWITVFLWLASRHVLLNHYNGLETGCLLMLYALAWRLYQLNWLEGWKLWGIGAVLGLLVLARIDAAVFVAVLSIMELFRPDTAPRARVMRFAILAGVPLTISAPWWLYNLLGFGSLMPSSGTAESVAFSASRIGPWLNGLLQAWVPFVQLRWIQGLPQAGIQVGIILLIAFAFRKKTPASMKDFGTLRFGAVLVISLSLLSLYYLSFSGAWFFYTRYLAPLMLVSVSLTAVVLARADGFYPLARLAAVIFLGLVAALSIFGWDFQKGTCRSPYLDQVGLVESYVPAGDTVSAGQSGTLCYFRDRVVNLDGKVNPKALPYRNNSWEYLELHHIVWYCDWESGYLGTDPASHGWTQVAQRGRFLLYHFSQPTL